MLVLILIRLARLSMFLLFTFTILCVGSNWIFDLAAKQDGFFTNEQHMTLLEAQVKARDARIHAPN